MLPLPAESFQGRPGLNAASRSWAQGQAWVEGKGPAGGEGGRAPGSRGGDPASRGPHARHPGALHSSFRGLNSGLESDDPRGLPRPSRHWHPRPARWERRRPLLRWLGATWQSKSEKKTQLMIGEQRALLPNSGMFSSSNTSERHLSHKHRSSTRRARAGAATPGSPGQEAALPEPELPETARFHKGVAFDTEKGGKKATGSTF